MQLPIDQMSPEQRRAHFKVTEPAELLNNHADALQREGKTLASLVASRRALALCPGSPFLMAGLGAVLWDAGHYDEGVAVLRKAIELDPCEPRGWGNLGTILAAQRKFEESQACFAKALQILPDSPAYQWNYAVSRLDAGAWAEGLALYESRIPNRGPMLYPKFPFPMWEGEDLAGKRLYVQAEQGIGDRILFSRYLVWVKETWPSCEILFLANSADVPSLTNLLWEFRHHVTFLHDGTPYPEADYGCFLGSLPRLHGTRTDFVPRDPGFILKRAQLDFDQYAIPDPHVPALKVGICWTGNPKMSRNAERSIPLEMLLEIEANPRVQLFNLQFGAGAHDIKRLGAGELIGDYSHEFGRKGLVGTAAVMLHLHLVITVCTSTAHMAGALGIPCWTLLCDNCYWVWGRHGDTSIWYPGMKLYRQQTMGDWRPVMDSVAADVDRYARMFFAPKETLVA